jgi:hypothetical protein
MTMQQMMDNPSKQAIKKTNTNHQTLSQYYKSPPKIFQIKLLSRAAFEYLPFSETG